MQDKMNEELLAYILPEGVLKWFEVTGVERTERLLRIMLEEKNEVPILSEEHRGKRISSLGFKPITIDDFPIRGRKTELVFLRRIWQAEGVKQLIKRDIPIEAPGTKLEKEFAAFLKEAYRIYGGPDFVDSTR